jgi:hypothetical protein
MKPFGEQYIECKQNGNLIRVECIWCKQENLVCIRHKTYCHSKACCEEREKEEP